MIKDYFKIALRYLNKHKVYTLINVSVRAVSIACCILIMLFVRSEFSFDRFHLKSGRIYRAWLEEHYEGTGFYNSITPPGKSWVQIPAGLVTMLSKDFVMTVLVASLIAFPNSVEVIETND